MACSGHAGAVKTIGFIGGMSWESTAVYFRVANEMVRRQLGGLHSARTLTVTVDFAEIEQMQVAGRWSDAGDLLAELAAGLEAAGADLIVLCTNTMHKVSAQIEAAIAVPFIHLAEVTADAVLAADITRVGLLGTAFTMEQDFYIDRLAARGLDVILPDAQDRAEVHRIIYDELCVGIVSDESRETYLGVIDRFDRAGADGVILGCTEIELLIGQADADLPVFPTTRIHTAAAVSMALGQSVSWAE